MTLAPLRRRTVAAITLAVTCVVAGALLVAPATAVAPVSGVTTAAAAPDPDGTRPSVGSCHALTSREAARAADPDPAVPCSRKHTSRTFAVPTVPAGVDMADVEGIGRLTSRLCTPTFVRVTNRSDYARFLSAYSYVWFTPTQPEIDAGAHWIRCDLTLAGGPGSLAPLPRAKQPALGTAPHPDREARCQLGKRADYAITVCSRSHVFRAEGAYRMAGKRYPGPRKAFAEARRRCPRFVGRKPFLVSYASRAAFYRGSKLAVCSVRTTR